MAPLFRQKYNNNNNNNNNWILIERCAQGFDGEA
jgi:hypothetical protein